jgi:hypothetical protein
VADNDINFTHENGRKTLKLRLRYTGHVQETMSQVFFEHMQMRFALISRRPCNDYPRQTSSFESVLEEKKIHESSGEKKQSSKEKKGNSREAGAWHHV